MLKRCLLLLALVACNDQATSTAFVEIPVRVDTVETVHIDSLFFTDTLIVTDTVVSIVTDTLIVNDTVTVVDTLFITDTLIVVDTVYCKWWHCR